MGKYKETKNVKGYCRGNLKRFLRETTLHGLKYLADDSISIWEKSFFLFAFLAAIITTVNLITNVYAKWISTPIIIGISPHPTSILTTPLPAITVCNMNQVLASRVANYTPDSNEGALLKSLCNSDAFLDDKLREAPNFKYNNLSYSEFIHKHAQPCSSMLLSCTIRTDRENCSEIFQEIITDEGLCCVFNFLHPKFRLTINAAKKVKIRDRTDDRKALDWDPETGYPPELPVKYTPRAALGTGVAMGLSLVLDAELDEYYCSTSNGPGFKVDLHSPIEATDIKETGLVLPIGYETRFRIDVISSEASNNVRSLTLNSRQCLFKGEGSLLYYAHYSRRNCESECQAKYIYEQCQCQPYNLPVIFDNATICGIQQTLCVRMADDKWMKGGGHQDCRAACLPACFDLTYRADGSMTPLRRYDYITPPSVLTNMSLKYINKNVAVVHFYYREYIFHGDLKNVYVGFTEFLSNTGGILGLFMGFSFVSVAEIIYFAFMRPIIKLIGPAKRNRRTAWKTKSMVRPRLF